MTIAAQTTTTTHTNGKPPASKPKTERIKEHILGALAAINDTPGAVFELSIARNWRGKLVFDKGYFSDRAALALEAAKQTLKPASVAVYVNLQQIDPNCLARAHNKISDGAKPMTAADVTRYTRFLIDVDRAGVKGISATDAEKAEIFDALAAIREFLVHELDWPDPRFDGDSGNGAHIAWELDLPPTKENQDLLERCYQALQQKFGSDILSIDASLADPNQLIKLYGTMTRKGDDTPDRPHRFSKLLNTYETEPVTLEQLQALAALYEPPKTAKKGKGDGKRKYWKAGTPEAVEAWAEGHGLTLGPRTADSHPQTGDGYKWRVDCLTSDEHQDGAVIILNGSGYLKYRCQHNGCADKTVADVLDLHPAPKKGKGDGATGEEEAGSLWEKCVEDLIGLGYSFRMNELDDCVECNGERLSDGLDAEIIMRMMDMGWKEAGYIRLAWTAEAHQRRYHPVKDFLNGLVWDGQDHLAKLERYIKDAHPQIIYENGDRMPVIGAWLRRWGVAAVGKVLGGRSVSIQNPMIVFVGGQDVGKSTLAKWLCPLPSDVYFIESHIEPDSTDHLRYLSSKLVWEVGELGRTTRKADREGLKAFLTKTEVTFRVPWGKHAVTKPAMASFIGTINPETGFLNDPTGHRRYLPVEIKSIKFDYLTEVDPVQLWAQFVALYRAGEPVNLTPEERAMADAIRTGHETEDNFAGFICKYYDIDLTKAEADIVNRNWSATTADIVDQLDMNGVKGCNATNVGIALRGLGLVRAREKVNGVREVRWYGLYRNAIGRNVRP